MGEQRGNASSTPTQSVRGIIRGKPIVEDEDEDAAEQSVRDSAELEREHYGRHYCENQQY